MTCSGDKIILSMSANGSLTTFYCLTLISSLNGHWFQPMFMFSSTVPFAKKAWIFCMATLLTKKKVHHL